MLKIKTGHLPEYLILIFEEYFIYEKADLMPVPLEVDIARRLQNFSKKRDSIRPLEVTFSAYSSPPAAKRNFLMHHPKK